MATLKTTATDASVGDFIAALTDDRRRHEAETLVTLMSEVTGAQPVMWGPSIIGFGLMRYTYATGRHGDWMKVGFSPRKAALSLYGLRETAAEAGGLEPLGPHTSGVGCVYVKRLDHIDLDVLRRLVRAAFARGDYVSPRPSEVAKDA